MLSSKATSSGKDQPDPRRRGGFLKRAAQRVLAGRAGAFRREVRSPSGIAGTLVGRRGRSAGARRARRRGRCRSPEPWPWSCRVTTGSAPWRSRLGASAAQAEAFRRAGEDDQEHGQEHPDRRRDHRDLGEESPALVPKALEPPTPPKAPARPPPLPRWIRMRQIRKSETRTISTLKMSVKTSTGIVLCSYLIRVKMRPRRATAGHPRSVAAGPGNQPCPGRSRPGPPG